MVAQPARRLFTVDEYYRMAEAGILGEDDRVELIQGDIVAMSPIGSPHAACVNRLTRLFGRLIGDRAILSIQGPLRLNNRSEPVPDVLLLSPRADFYSGAHPGPADVQLLVEVSDTTLAYDSGIKLRLYARSGIPEVWIVDVAGKRVLVHREPRATGYGFTSIGEHGSTLTLAAFPEVQILVDDILG